MRDLGGWQYNARLGRYMCSCLEGNLTSCLFLALWRLSRAIVVIETSHLLRLFHGVYVISQGAGKVTHENRGSDDGMNPCVIRSAVNTYVRFLKKMSNLTVTQWYIHYGTEWTL
jgi:hypothetical protein